VIVPKLKAPIVLVHGVLGFSRLRFCGWTLADYFARIPASLASAGNRVLVPRLSPTGSITDRASSLKASLDHEAPGEAVHLIAHSMGGLDSRYLISRLGMGHRVLSLTTLGTPHRGSSFADWCVQRLDRLARPIFERLGISYQALHDLTVKSCRVFNELTPDDPSVRYFSVRGRHSGGWFSPEWQLPHRVVTMAEGQNDGIVSAASAAYGESQETWAGDHVSLINWHNPVALRRGLCHERTPYFAALIRRLADEGF
jgi:triacylglycerol lipase